MSPDGGYLASVGYGEKHLRLWEAATAKLIQELASPKPDDPCSVAFSSDGKLIATASLYGPIYLRSVPDGELLVTFSEHKQNAHNAIHAAFSPKEAVLASVGTDRKIILWDLKTHKVLRQWQSDAPLWSLAYSPDGKLLATGSSDPATGSRAIQIWDPATGKEVRSIRYTGLGAQSLAFGPDNKTLWAVISGGRSVRRWDATTGKEIENAPGHHGRVASVAFTPDGRSVVSFGEDLTIRVWNAASGKQVRQMQPDGGQFPAELRNIAPVFALSADGTRAAAMFDGGPLAGSSEKKLGGRVWDVASGKPLFDLVLDRYMRRTTAAFSPDGRQVASVGWGVALWSKDDKDGPRRIGPRLRDVKPKDRGFNELSAVYLPDGRTVAAGYSDGRIRLLDLSSGDETAVFEPGVDTIVGLGSSPDGRYLVSVSGFFGDDKTATPVAVWDVLTGRLVRMLSVKEVTDEPAGPVEHAALAPDNVTLAVTGRKKEGVFLAVLLPGIGFCLSGSLALPKLALPMAPDLMESAWFGRRPLIGRFGRMESTKM